MPLGRLAWPVGASAKCGDVRFRAALGVIADVTPTSFEAAVTRSGHPDCVPTPWSRYGFDISVFIAEQLTMSADDE